MHPAKAFAMLQRGLFRLVLSSPNPQSGGGSSMPDGAVQTLGGWNRFSIEVPDLENLVSKLKSSAVRFRNEIVNGIGGKQVTIEDPSNNPIELFQPTIDEARLNKD